MRVLDLFSGIGGISYGLSMAGGFKTVGFCEIDPFCRIVLEKYWPSVPIWEDVCELSEGSIRERCGDIDLIVGGFPCQPHSVAGKRKGQSDERHLWPEFSRLVREIRPRWVLAENVPGIRSTAADEVIGDLEAEGYAVWPLVVGADDVGAPHRRKRVWFVAHRECLGLEGSWTRAISAGEKVTVSPSICETRWPSRPGEPQHEWEESRLAYGADLYGDAGDRKSRCEVPKSRNGRSAGDEAPRSPQLPLGSTTDGLSLRLVRRANREALKAYGNAVVPQVVCAIGKAMLYFEKERHADIVR